jgi:hypothetical protein
MSRYASLAITWAFGVTTSAWASNGQMRDSYRAEGSNATQGGSREVSAAAPSYILQAGYSCPAGYQHLVSSWECQQAAAQVVPNGNSLTVDANTPSSTQNPQYCYVFGDWSSGFTNLYWNPEGTTSGSWDKRSVICKQTPPSYILQPGYSCPSGYRHLAGAGECQYASKQIVPNGFSLNINYDTPSAGQNPQYCYVYGDSASGFTSLYWNPGGVTYGSWPQRNVICKMA